MYNVYTHRYIYIHTDLQEQLATQQPPPDSPHWQHSTLPPAWPSRAMALIPLTPLVPTPLVPTQRWPLASSGPQVRHERDPWSWRALLVHDVDYNVSSALYILPSLRMQRSTTWPQGPAAGAAFCSSNTTHSLGSMSKGSTAFLISVPCVKSMWG